MIKSEYFAKFVTLIDKTYFHVYFIFVLLIPGVLLTLIFDEPVLFDEEDTLYFAKKTQRNLAFQETSSALLLLVNSKT